MKFVLALLLVGTVTAKIGCGAFGHLTEGNGMLDIAKGPLNPFSGHMNAVLDILQEGYTTCSVLEEAFAVTRSANCKPIFDAGFCLGVELAFHPASAVDSVVHWNSYNNLMPDMENVASLACSHAAACSEDVLAFTNRCFTSQNTEDELMEMAKALAGYYETNFAANVAAWEPKNALMKQIIDMVMKKFTDFDSVIAFAKEHATEERVADAKEKGLALLGIASNFCEEGCFSETASFVTGITEKMVTSPNCPNALAYCGGSNVGCKRFAEGYIRTSGIPCCLFGTIADVIEQAEALIATYGAEALAAIEAVKGTLNEEAKKLYNAYEATATHQWGCVKKTWTKTKEAASCA